MLVQIETNMGDVWVNPEHVVSVEDILTGATGSEIILTTGDKVTAKISAKAAANRFNNSAPTLGDFIEIARRAGQI